MKLLQNNKKIYVHLYAAEFNLRLYGILFIFLFYRSNQKEIIINYASEIQRLHNNLKSF